MPALKNHKHELFAGFVARGERPARAYALAGYSGKGAGQSASRLLRIPCVDARVKDLRETQDAPAREDAIARAVIDREYVLSKLKAVVEEHAKDNPGPAVRALELMGKELGMFREPRAEGSGLETVPADVLVRALELTRALIEREKAGEAGPLVIDLRPDGLDEDPAALVS